MGVSLWGGSWRFAWITRFELAAHNARETGLGWMGQKMIHCYSYTLKQDIIQ